MEKKAFIKVESDEVGARIHSNGSNYQMLLMMSLLIQAFKDGQLTNEDDPKNETFKQIVDFIFKKPREASIALIHIIGVDGDLDFYSKMKRRLIKWIRLKSILLN